MELQKGIPVADRPADELIEAVDNCCLCGHKLAFYHITDFKKSEVMEEARCPACGIKNKMNSYILQ